MTDLIVNENSDEQLYQEVRSILINARDKAYNQANSIMTYAYWDVGQSIVLHEQKGKARADYGANTIENLSRRLGDEFGSGFSVASLKNCRQLYQAFPKESQGYSLIGTVKWSHLREIMRIDNEDEKIFYLKEVAAENWPVRSLQRNIRTGYYKRVLSTQLPDKSVVTRDFIKDPYVLEFMGVNPSADIKEKTVENSVISNMQRFLMELGKGFAFIARQMHICTETADFYCDLVFYNYILKCFVIVDLKVEKLTHEAIGQMDMYVRMFDDLKRRPDDNPTIGLIMCTDKDETMVKYSVLNDSKQIFASKYMLVLPTEEELLRELERNQEIYRSVDN